MAQTTSLGVGISGWLDPTSISAENSVTDLQPKDTSFSGTSLVVPVRIGLTKRAVLRVGVSAGWGIGTAGIVQASEIECADEETAGCVWKGSDENWESTGTAFQGYGGGRAQLFTGGLTLGPEIRLTDGDIAPYVGVGVGVNMGLTLHTVCSQKNYDTKTGCPPNIENFPFRPDDVDSHIGNTEMRVLAWSPMVDLSLGVASGNGEEPGFFVEGGYSAGGFGSSSVKKQVQPGMESSSFNYNPIRLAAGVIFPL